MYIVWKKYTFYKDKLYVIKKYFQEVLHCWEYENISYYVSLQKIRS